MGMGGSNCKWFDDSKSKNRKLVELKLGRKFITAKEKDELRKKVLAHNFTPK